MTPLDRTVRRIVAAEERRIDDHAAHDATQSEADDREVVAGRALAAAFPTVHPLAAVRVLVLLPDGLRGPQKVFLFREVVIRRVEHGAAEAFGGEVEEVSEVGHGSKSVSRGDAEARRKAFGF